MVVRQDFTIEKGAKFYVELDLVDAAGVAIDLTDKTLRCIVKESTATETILHDLTEDNDGIEVLDDAGGRIALFISSEDTLAVEADFAVYQVIKIDNNFPLLDNERTLEGKITYTKGFA